MRRTLAITGSIVFVDTMLFGAIIPLLPRFAEDYDQTKLEAGALLGAYGGGTLVGGLPAGILVGRISTKRGVIAGLLLLAASSLGFALAGGSVALGIARFAQGLASSLTWVSRKLLPDGSRKPESMPYGYSSGSEVNSTPRALSSS